MLMVLQLRALPLRNGHSHILHFVFLLFCIQVLWRIAVGDILFGIHALP